MMAYHKRGQNIIRTGSAHSRVRASTDEFKSSANRKANKKGKFSAFGKNITPLFTFPSLIECRPKE